MKRLIGFICLSIGMFFMQTARAPFEPARTPESAKWHDFVKDTQSYYEHYFKAPIEQWHATERIELANRLAQRMETEKQQQAFQKDFTNHVDLIYQEVLKKGKSVSLNLAQVESLGRIAKAYPEKLKQTQRTLVSRFIEDAINLESSNKIKNLIDKAEALGVNREFVLDALADRARERVWNKELFEGSMPKQLRVEFFQAITKKAITTTPGHFDFFYDFVQKIGQGNEFIKATAKLIIEKTKWDSKKIKSIITREKAQREVMAEVNKLISAEIAGLSNTMPKTAEDIKKSEESIDSAYDKAKRFGREADFMDRLLEILPEKKTGYIPMDVTSLEKITGVSQTVLNALKDKIAKRIPQIDTEKDLTPEKLNNFLNAAMRFGFSQEIIKKLSTLAQTSENFKKIIGQPDGLDALKTIAAREIMQFVLSENGYDNNENSPTQYFNQLITVIKNFDLTQPVVNEVVTKLSRERLKKISNIKNKVMRTQILTLINEHINSQVVRVTDLNEQQLADLISLANQFDRGTSISDAFAKAILEGKLTKKAFEDKNINKGLHDKVLNKLNTLIDADIKKLGTVALKTKDLQIIYENAKSYGLESRVVDRLAGIAFQTASGKEYIEKIMPSSKLQELRQKINTEVIKKIEKETQRIANLSSLEIDHLIKNAQEYDLMGKVLSELAEATLVNKWTQKQLTEKVTDANIRTSVIDAINKEINDVIKTFDEPLANKIYLSELLVAAKNFDPDGLNGLAKQLANLENEPTFIDNFEKILEVIKENQTDYNDATGKIFRNAILDKLVAIVGAHPYHASKILKTLNPEEIQSRIKNDKLSIKSFLNTLTNQEVDKFGQTMAKSSDAQLKAKTQAFVDNLIKTFNPLSPDAFGALQSAELTRALLFAEGAGHEEQVQEALVNFAWQTGPEVLLKIKDEQRSKSIEDSINARFKLYNDSIQNGNILTNFILEFLHIAQMFNRQNEVFDAFDQAIDNGKWDIKTLDLWLKDHPDEAKKYAQEIKEFRYRAMPKEKLDALFDFMNNNAKNPDYFSKLSEPELKKTGSNIKTMSELLSKHSQLIDSPSFNNALNILDVARQALQLRIKELGWEKSRSFWETIFSPIIRWFRFDYKNIKPADKVNAQTTLTNILTDLKGLQLQVPDKDKRMVKDELAEVQRALAILTI